MPFSIRIHTEAPASSFTDVPYTVISFGVRCTAAIACKYANVRNMSMPFDWLMPLLPSKMHTVLVNDFANFLPDVRNGEHTNVYGLQFAHFHPDVEEGIRQYERRIQRWRSVMRDGTKKVFVFINEDYLYDPTYREPGFNRQMFQDMLALEKFLRNEYSDLNYTILYMDFVQHQIPEDSKVIQIVITSDTFYQHNEENPNETERFRSRCGEMLSSLFNTSFAWGYSADLFWAE